MFDLRPIDGSSLAGLARTVDDNLRAFLEALRGPRSEVLLAPLAVEPAKPREGMVVFADGTNWNPGAGVGVYVRAGAAWVKL